MSHIKSSMYLDVSIDYNTNSIHVIDTDFTYRSIRANHGIIGHIIKCYESKGLNVAHNIGRHFFNKSSSLHSIDNIIENYRKYFPHIGYAKYHLCALRKYKLMSLVHNFKIPK